MANIGGEITTWLKSLKGWQTELAYRILTKECLNDADYSVLLEMLKGNNSFSAKEFLVIGVQSTNSGHNIRLRSIEAISNIEKLAPRKPLLFGEQNMVVVYGNNGSGKSGITRILKKTCGKPNAKDLKNNIYKANSLIGGCKIKYLNGEVEAEHDWQINGISISDLSCIDIYDSDTGTSYIKEAKSVSYTPKALALFESLSKEYGKIGSILSSEKDQLIRRLPNLPANYATTKAAQLFNNLNHSYSESNLAYIDWIEDKQNELNVLTERLNQKNPQIAAKEKRTNKVEAEKISLQIQKGVNAISKQNHNEIVRLRKEAQAKRKVATESVATFQKDIELEGVGSETRRALWEAAKQYSEMEAYKDNDFPNITEGAKCVLCHQPIEERAKGRFTSLKAFVEGTLEGEARLAERLLEEALTSLPQEINETDLRTKCNAAGLDDDWLFS